MLSQALASLFQQLLPIPGSLKDILALVITGEQLQLQQKFEKVPLDDRQEYMVQRDGLTWEEKVKCRGKRWRSEDEDWRQLHDNKMRERQTCPTEGEGKMRERSPWLEKKMELERKNYA